MLRILAKSTFTAMLACSILTAADFWVKKSFTDWTDKEAARMMINSPWAKQVSVPMGRGMGGGRGAGGRGGGGDIGGAGMPRTGGGGVGGGGGRGGSGDFGQVPTAPPAMTLTVRWHSALPVKQALVRSSLGSEGHEPSGELKQFLGREETHYIVAVAGLPARLGRLAENVDRLKQAAELRRKNKAPIAPDQVEVQTAGQSVNLYFLFPRSQAIELADQDVELALKLTGGPPPNAEGGQARTGGPPRTIEFKRKFKLKDMVYNDKLEL